MSAAPRWSWPEWVPESLRELVERDWNVDAARGLDPQQRWLANTRNNGAPQLGMGRVSAKLLLDGRVRAIGRYVHCWGNIGRVVTDRGEVVAVCSDGWEHLPAFVAAEAR